MEDYRLSALFDEARAVKATQPETDHAMDREANGATPFGRTQKASALNLQSIVTVLVGEHGRKFPVHEGLIRKTSKLFNAAMKLEWTSLKEESRLFNLSDAKPETFNIYVYWLYFKTLPTADGTDASSNHTEILDLAASYVLGEQLMDTAFKNCVIDALAEALTLSHPVTWPTPYLC